MSTLSHFYYEYHRTGFKKSRLFPKIQAAILQHIDQPCVMRWPAKQELAATLAIAYYCHADNAGSRWANLQTMERHPEWAFPHITRWADKMLNWPTKLAKYKALYNEGLADNKWWQDNPGAPALRHPKTDSPPNVPQLALVK